ncbi:MAG TPA: glycosyltransferase family 2 protein [Candidatus Kryptonia bacterium]|nr:glycosyltransferase family 2 protein [Candidatus Kryptonia bacterium]
MQSSDWQLSKSATGAEASAPPAAAQTRPVDLSIVVPAHNEAATLRQLWQETADALADSDLNWEMLIVDDGSDDDSPAILRELHAAHSRLGVLSLRRQCGKTAALALGFRAARGRLVVTLDGDLQDDPRDVPRVVAALADADVVNGWKIDRQDSTSRVLSSRVFNLVARAMFGLELHDMNCGLKGFHHEVVVELPLYGELHRFLPLLAHWRGFSVKEIETNHRPRRAGKSRYGLMRPFFGAMDLVTVLFLTRFRRRPAHLFGLAGIGLLLPGVAIALYITDLWMTYGNIQNHHPLLIGGVLLIVVGVQLMTAGIFGELIANVAAPLDREYPVRFQLEPKS